MAKKKGTSRLIQTERGVFSISKLFDSSSPDSKQLKLDNEWSVQNGLVEPPYPADMFLTLLESNSTFWAIVNQIASDVAGLGWSINLREGQTEDKNELAKIKEFIKHASPNSSFRTVLKELLIDWGSVGYFGMEVIRNNKGEVSKIIRVPAHTLRIHESHDKYCQIRSEKKVWFNKFGAEEDISYKTGKSERVGPVTKANELIYYRNIYQKSDWYGVPNIIAALRDVLGLIGSGEYNLAFFNNYGVPSAVVILSGEWSDGVEAEVERFISTEIKGNDNAHRTLVLKESEDCTIRFEPLDIAAKEGSFGEYETERKENILVAYSMPPERVGIRVTGELGGNVAEEAMRVYKSGVIEPLQTDLEDILNQKILEQGLGITKYELKFVDIDIRDLDALVERLCKQVEYSLMTPNEARALLGRKPYEGGNKFFVDPNWLEAGIAEEE